VSCDTSLKAKLHELGDVICNLGNPCIGNAVKTVCDSPDRGASLFKVVAAEINRQKNHRQSTEREKFFQQFRWKGQSLSLAAATKNWELNDNDLEEYSSARLTIFKAIVSHANLYYLSGPHPAFHPAFPCRSVTAKESGRKLMGSRQGTIPTLAVPISGSVTRNTPRS
ncbi:hypothetical protein ACJ73_08385, partial [Blastomyces percursus]